MLLCIIPVCITVNILPVFLFTKKKEMPPKTLPEKSDVIVNTLKYFETLTLIVKILKRQEITESDNDTEKLNESDY